VRQSTAFIKFYLTATSFNKIQEPWLKDFAEHILFDDRNYYSFAPLQGLKQILLAQTTMVSVTDLGAGSRVSKSNKRSIQSIAKNAVSPRWQCELLFKLIHHYQLKNRLELGTSLGVNTLYQYLPLKTGKFVTLEGCPNIAQIARSNFKRLNVQDINLYEGNFDKTLPSVLQELQVIDYAFLDGNHQEKATIAYFNKILPYCSDKAILVLDDIYWSEGMLRAWQQIQAHPSVEYAVDLFFMGILKINKKTTKKQLLKIQVPASLPTQQIFN
jgi:predicted O-methyltransferase YrrM